MRERANAEEVGGTTAAGLEGRESAGGADAHRVRSLLGVTEVGAAQEHLLPGSEGRHPEVGAAGAAESVAQVAISTSRLGLGARLFP